MTTWLAYSGITGAVLGVMFHLAWDPSPSASSGYVEYVIVGDRDHQRITNDIKNAHTVIWCGTNLNLLIAGPNITGKWYYVCYAVMSNVWSDPSNMIEVDVPHPATNVVRAALDVSPDMKLWTNAGFIRLRITP